MCCLPCCQCDYMTCSKETQATDWIGQPKKSDEDGQHFLERNFIGVGANCVFHFLQLLPATETRVGSDKGFTACLDEASGHRNSGASKRHREHTHYHHQASKFEQPETPRDRQARQKKKKRRKHTHTHRTRATIYKHKTTRKENAVLCHDHATIAADKPRCEPTDSITQQQTRL